MAENTTQKAQSLKQLQNREKILGERKARLKGELDQVSAEYKDVRARRIEAEKVEKAKPKEAKKPAKKAQARPAAGEAGAVEA